MLCSLPVTVQLFTVQLFTVQLFTVQLFTVQLLTVQLVLYWYCQNYGSWFMYHLVVLKLNPLSSFAIFTFTHHLFHLHPPTFCIRCKQILVVKRYDFHCGC